MSDIIDIYVMSTLHYKYAKALWLFSSDYAVGKNCMYCRTFVLLLVMMNDAIQCLILNLFDYDSD